MSSQRNPARALDPERPPPGGRGPTRWKQDRPGWVDRFALDLVGKQRGNVKPPVGVRSWVGELGEAIRYHLWLWHHRKAEQ